MILLWLIYLLFIVIVIFILYRFKVELAYKDIPGPRSIPVIGSTFSIIGDAEHIWHMFQDINKNFAPVYRVVTPFFITVGLLDPNDLEILFTNSNSQKKSLIYNLLQEWLGTGLLTSYGEKWKSRRKTLTAGFHFNILNKYAQTFFDESKLMIKKMQNKQGAFIENIQEWSTNITLAIICETAMGCSSSIFEQKEGKDYKEAVHFEKYSLIYRMLRSWYIILKPLYVMKKMYKVQKKAIQTLHDFSWKIIKTRLDGAEKKEAAALIAEHESNKSSSMLDILIDAYKKGEIDIKGIQEEVDTFIFEGYDTTASALSFSLLCLAEYKDVQIQAREEVDKIWEECGGNITVNEIQKLTYLERVIKETLRLYPSVPIISREVTDDLKLTNYTLPKGAHAHVHIYDIHRDPKLWSDPTKFDPDRFLLENSKKRHPYSYIPFSAGFRNCIGQKFAMMELKTILLYILHNFYLEPISTTKDIRPVVDLIFKSVNPLYIKFVPINE